MRSLEAISTLAKTHGANCDALAAELAVHASRNSSHITAFNALMKDPAKQQAITTRYGDRMRKIAQNTVTSLRDHCATHRGVGEVLGKLQ